MSNALPSRSHRCQQHRSAPAGWRCNGCGKYLCPACTARVVTQYFCCLCDAEATRLTSHRSQRPYSSWLVDALVYPFRRGIVALLVVAATLVLASYAAVMALDPAPKEGEAAVVKPASTEARSVEPAADPPAAPVTPPRVDADNRPLSPIVFPAFRALVIFLFVFLVGAAAARGGRGGSFKVGWLLKALVATLIVWAPGVGYLVFMQQGLPTAATFRDPLAWLYLCLAVVYLPVATAAAAADSPLVDLINPYCLFGWAVRVGWRYWVTVAVLIALAAAALRLGDVGMKLASSIERPLVGRFLSELLVLLPFAMIGRLTGWLLFVHGEAFEWGSPRDFLDPILKEEANGNRLRQETPGNEVSGLHQLGAAQREKPEPMAAKEVIRTMEEGNLARAVKLYAARASWEPSRFNDRQLYELAGAAARSKNHALGEQLYLAASEKRGQLAARALLALAKLYEDGFKTPDKATEVYQRIVKTYPGTDQAKAAEIKLRG